MEVLRFLILGILFLLAIYVIEMANNWIKLYQIHPHFKVPSQFLPCFPHIGSDPITICCLSHLAHKVILFF